jgi:energy-coupling factor transport system ATP-binding protein
VHRYGPAIEALRGVDLSVEPGEFVAIVGANGAGKTTLAKHLVGLLRPARGTVRIMGQDIARLPVHHVSRWIGYLFQDPDWQIFNNTCLDEAAYGLRLRERDAARAREAALAALARLGLAGVADAHPYTLSRGQRQRLGMAAALAMRPPILVVDEPTTGLDYKESLAIMDVLEEYRKHGGTVLVITHDVDLAARFARRIVVMAGGRVTHDLPADRIQDHLEELETSSIVLPEVARLARALHLPFAPGSVDRMAAVLAYGHAPDERR